MSLLLAAGLLAGFVTPQRETVDVSAIVGRLGTSASVSGDYDILDRPAGRSRYYGYWLSHGTSFYAPIRTQRLIREQWKIFVASFQCRSNLSKRRWDPSFFNG